MSTKDFRTKEEIIITIGEGESGADAANADASKQQPRRSAFVPPSRPDSKQQNRRILGGLLNLYDLGEQKDLDSGLFIDKTFSIIPTTAALNTFVLSGGDGVTTGQIIAAQNTPLAVPLQDWKTRFRKVSYADAKKYRIGIDIGNPEIDKFYEDNPNWTTGGLKTNFPDFEINSLKNTRLTDETAVYYDQTATLSINGIFRYFFADSSDFKITSEPFYSADAVSFDLTKGAIDVYINRTIFKIVAFKAPSSGVDTRVIKELNHFYSALPFSVFGNDALRFERDPATEETELKNDMIDALITHPQARQLALTYDPITGTPHYALDSGIYGWNLSDPAFDYSLQFDELRAAGMLFMAFNKGNLWRFVWYND